MVLMVLLVLLVAKVIQFRVHGLYNTQTRDLRGGSMLHGTAELLIRIALGFVQANRVHMESTWYGITIHAKSMEHSAMYVAK